MTKVVIGLISNECVMSPDIHVRVTHATNMHTYIHIYNVPSFSGLMLALMYTS